MLYPGSVVPLAMFSPWITFLHFSSCLFSFFICFCYSLSFCRFVVRVWAWWLKYEWKFAKMSPINWSSMQAECFVLFCLRLQAMIRQWKWDASWIGWVTWQPVHMSLLQIHHFSAIKRLVSVKGVESFFPFKSSLQCWQEPKDNIYHPPNKINLKKLKPCN